MTKVVVKIRVIDGSHICLDWGKLYEEKEVVKTVVDASITKAAEREQRPLIFESVEAARSEPALDSRGTELDPADINDLSVGDVRDSFSKEQKAAYLKVASGGGALPHFLLLTSFLLRPTYHSLHRAPQRWPAAAHFLTSYFLLLASYFLHAQDPRGARSIRWPGDAVAVGDRGDYEHAEAATESVANAATRITL